MPAELPQPAPTVSHAFCPQVPEPGPAARVSTRRRAKRARLAAGWLLTLLLLLSGAVTTALAQGTPPPPPECAADEKFANTWYFGFKAGLDFNQASAKSLPKVLTNGAMDAPAGSGVMSDKDGKILFYSNGETVWNGDGTVMTNGTGLAGNRFTTDGPLPLKMPGIPQAGQPTRYLLFTLKDTVGLRYSEIDIPAGGGPGTVIAATKNTPLARGTAEKITGVFHKNGCDIWVITHGWGDAKTGNNNRGDAFLAYRVKQAAGYIGPVLIDAPIPSTVGSLHAPSVAALGYKGQMKVTPDGQRLALARYSEVLGDNSSTVELFGFNTSTGDVTVNPQVPYIVDRGAGKYYGVGFSPGSYLYATVRNPAKLLQFDISGNGPVTRQEIPLKQKTPADLGSMQAAPDGKIYVARDNQPALGVIPYPDSLGAKVRYADDSLKLGGTRLSGLGLVNFNQSSLLRVGPSFEITGCRQISFKAPPIDFDGKTYAWTFGDGTLLSPENSKENPVHTYATPGDYVVTLRITTACFCRESSGTILVPALPDPGKIAATQTVCAGTAPALLTSTTDASGDAGLPLVYQWESSPNNGPFVAVNGATSATYTPPSSLPVGTTAFRRRVQLLLPNRSGPYCESKFTTAVTITVLPNLKAGSIAADQTVCAGAAATPLTSTAPAMGGTGTPAYQWQSSSDNSIWVPASGINTDATYTPGALTATTYFRRRATSGPCTALSNTVVVTVAPTLAAGTIAADQPLCAGAAPSPLTSTALAAGGTGAIAYQWESMLGNAPWGPVPGPGNDATYAPGALTGTTYFRRRATSASGCAPVFSNVVVITVTPALAAGAIAASQGLCPDAAPAPFTSTAAASGGNGSFSYQWETSADNSNWVPAPSTATGETYTPNTPATTTYHRRRVTSGVCGPAYSNVVTLTVLPPLSAGSISASQTICTGATPSSLSSTTEAGGGTGTFTYQWEFSTDNVYWNPVTGETKLTFAPGPLTATTYFRRRATSGTGTCSTAVSNVLTILVQPIVTPAVSLATPPAQCPGTAFTFTAVATNVGPTPAYQWFVNNVTVATGPSFSSSTLVTGDQVRVEVTPTAGLCVTTNLVAATVTVTRTPTPQPTLAIAVQPDGPVCLGALLTFSIASVTEAGPTPDYQWQVNGNDVTGARGTVFTSTALRGGQIVTLRLRTTNVCGQPVTAVSNGVVVRIQPPVVVNAGPDKEILLGTSVVLEGSADGNYPVTWTPATGLTIPANDPLHPVAAPTVTTTYTLSAGAGGCASSDQVTVTVRPPIRIPNAFTPNNDGRDDTWQIEFIEQFPDNTVSVFNRWGNRVFSTEHYSRANEWRGDINGQPAPVGTYYYVVVTKGPLGRSYAGSITVLY